MSAAALLCPTLFSFFFPLNRVLCCNKDTVRFAAKFSSEAALSGRIRAARFGAVAADEKGRPRTMRKKSYAPKKRRSLLPKESRTMKKKRATHSGGRAHPSFLFFAPDETKQKNTGALPCPTPPLKNWKKNKIGKKGDAPGSEQPALLFLGPLLPDCCAKENTMRGLEASRARAAIGVWDKKWKKMLCMRRRRVSFFYERTEKEEYEKKPTTSADMGPGCRTAPSCSDRGPGPGGRGAGGPTGDRARSDRRCWSKYRQ